MSVDLSLIIPNKCRSLRDKDDARICFNDTIEQVVKYFHGRKQFVTEVTMREQDDDSDDIEYSFAIPLLNITAYMKAGYWDVWSVAGYGQYFYPYGTDLLGKPKFWPRNVCFNTLLAFGHSEGWICDEFHSWNCKLEDIDSNFEDWKAYGESPRDCKIYEFDVANFADVNPQKQKWAEYEGKYHDAYKECHAVLNTIRQRFPDLDILTIEEPLANHAIVVKDSKLFILNYITGKCLLDNNPIDNCRTDFNGAGIQVFKGNESAFFNREGRQLTDFRVGEFSWEWDTRSCNFLGQIITDKATGKRFLTDGTPYPKK